MNFIRKNTIPFILTLVMNLGVLLSQTQSDMSDTLWRIVKPIVNSNNIDMNQCLLGSIKDSVFDDFISNLGSWRFRVDSIYFRSGDSNCFSLVSGIPVYEVMGNSTKATEFRFIPIREGLHQSEIVVITQNDTIYKAIAGEGVKQYLQVMTNIIDFGKVEIGDEKVYTDTVVLKNISDEEIEISKTLQLPPYNEQFYILNGGGQFNLLPNETRMMTLQFKPKFAGRTSGRIGFEFNKTGSPANADLFGTGIGGLAFVENDSGFTNEIKHIKIMLSKVKPEGIASLANNFSIKIRFQKTLLAPKKNTNWYIEKDSTYLIVEGKFSSSFELVKIPLLVGLGNVEETAIDIIDLLLKDDKGNIVDYDIEKKSGIFKLLGICREGGTRLFESDEQLILSRVSPNPATGDFELKINIIEKGITHIYITNSIGAKIKEIFNDEITKPGEYKYNVNTKDLSNGLYYIVLQTPTVRKLEKIIIDK